LEAYPGRVNGTTLANVAPSRLLSTSRAFAVDASQTLNSVVPLAPLYLDLNGNVCP